MIERKDILRMSLRKKMRRVGVVVVEWAVVAMMAEGTVLAVVMMMAVASMGRRRSHSRFE